jgi:hypothetical protein
MLDNPDMTAELLAKLEAAVPIPAIIPQPLGRLLRRQAPGAAVPNRCQVVSVFYAGDEGGIMCGLGGDGLEQTEQVFIASITHLEFDWRTSLAREITGYQKRRTRKLRRQYG